MSDPVRIERTKLTAAYLNAAAGSLLTAGVIAPVLAAVFGFGAGQGVTALTLVVAMPIFLFASLAMHVAARYVLRGLQS